MNATNALIAFASFLLSVGFDRLNTYLDPWFAYAQGTSLIYLPAGIKLLCLLVGRKPAFVGLVAASEYIGYNLWTENSYLSTTFLAFVSNVIYFTDVLLITKWFGIDEHLSNLKYWHIVLLAALGCMVNGFVLNFAYYTQNVTPVEALLSKGAALAFGDFLGCFAIVALFHTAIIGLKSMRSQTDSR